MPVFSRTIQFLLRVNKWFSRILVFSPVAYGLSEAELRHLVSNSPIEQCLMWKSLSATWHTEQFDRRFCVKAYCMGIMESVCYMFRKSTAEKCYRSITNNESLKPIGFVEFKGPFYSLSLSCFYGEIKEMEVKE